MLAAYRGHAEFLDEIRGHQVEVDQWQLERLALVGLKNELFFFTPGADAAQMGCLGPRAFVKLDEAVAALLDGLPADALVVLVPEGPYAFARVQREAAFSY
jgi:hypothetical protein